MDDGQVDREERGFRPIGSLTPPIENSRTVSASTQTTPSMSSATSGLPSPESAGQRSIGRRRGATDAATLPSVKEAFAANNPTLVDRSLLASLPPCVTSALVPVRVDHSTERYGYDAEIVSYTVGNAPLEEIKRALWMVEYTLRPTPDAKVKSELARLKVTTKSRAEAGEDLALALAAYAEYLAKYPEDVVVDALRYWARNETWWPSWSELKGLLDYRVKKRRALRDALQRAAA